MAYRNFKDFKVAQENGFVNAHLLAETCLEQSKHYASMPSVLKPVASHKMKMLFIRAGKAVTLEYLNAPADVPQITLAGVAIPTAGCAVMIDSRGGVGEGVFAGEARKSISRIVKLLGNWNKDPAAKGGSLPIDASVRQSSRFDVLVTQAYLHGDEKLPTGHNPAQDFYTDDRGGLGTTLAMSEAWPLPNKLDRAMGNSFRTLTELGAKEANHVICVAFHMRSAADSHIQPLGYTLGVNDVCYLHDPAGRPTLHGATVRISDFLTIARLADQEHEAMRYARNKPRRESPAATLR